MEKNKPLTKSEFQVMDILWSLPEQSGFTGDILKAYPDPKPAYTTLATFLKIMKKKGFVDSDMVNKMHRFTPLISRDEYTRYFMNSVKDTYFGGSLVSLETGVAVAYSMNKLLDRGRFFVEPGEEIYAGQVVGEHTREKDLNINICKTKKLTNVRAAGSDEKIVLPPAIKFSLEEALEYIQEDELVEVTPHYMRIRKILLDPLARKRNSENED